MNLVKNPVINNNLPFKLIEKRLRDIVEIGCGLVVNPIGKPDDFRLHRYNMKLVSFRINLRIDRSAD